MAFDPISLLQDIQTQNGRVTILTGAGISAESGIPTLRGHQPSQPDR
ncbi:MAG: hypothetical protein ABIK15_00540 [Pseudomonadota bacterium]